MRNKLLIGAGILLTIFIVFLVIICGASSGGNNTLPEDDLKQIIYDVSCDVKDEESIDYDMSILLDETQFNDNIQNKNYTKIFTASPDYFFGSVQFANLVTGENYSEHSATSCFGINETNFPKDKKLNLNYPYVILFPSASNVQKRMGFVHFLNIAKYLYETIKNKTGKEIKCVLLGSKKDNDIFKGYGINLPYIKNLCGKYKLSELPYIFNKALFAVTNETCAVHFAHTAGLKNALVFCNVYPPSESFIEYLKNKKEGDTFLFGKPNMGDFYYLYPEISVQKAMDENYKPVENVDLRVNQDLEGINQKYIYAALDNIIDNVAGTIKWYITGL